MLELSNLYNGGFIMSYSKTDLDDVKNDLLWKYNTKAKNTFYGTTITDINEMYDEWSDTDIPLRYIQFIDGTTVFAVVNECRGFIEEYISKYAGDLFSDSGFEYLFHYFSNYMQKYQKKPYLEDGEMYKHMIYCILCDKNHIAYDKIKNDTLQFCFDTEYRNITDEYQPLSKDGVYFGTLSGNEIVSIVGTNTPLQNKVIDIGVETHKDYRQKGFAVSNVSAMSDYLTNNGKIALYGCNNKNENSIKTAISSGLTAIAKEKTLWYVGL